MAVSINKVMLAGNLTRKPEVRPIGNDKSVTSFGIAINKRYKAGNGEQREEVTFIDVEAWNKTGELVAQYLDKGSSCFIEGSLKLDQWDDKDGQKRSKLKVVADNVQFLSFKDKDGTAPAAQKKPNPQEEPDL
jgi:single-strand DNA-binding protein